MWLRKAEQFVTMLSIITYFSICVIRRTPLLLVTLTLDGKSTLCCFGEWQKKKREKFCWPTSRNTFINGWNVGRNLKRNIVTFTFLKVESGLFLLVPLLSLHRPNIYEGTSFSDFWRSRKESFILLVICWAICAQWKVPIMNLLGCQDEHISQ